LQRTPVASLIPLAAGFLFPPQITGRLFSSFLTKF
jgi:hypothetical protein